MSAIALRELAREPRPVREPRTHEAREAKSFASFVDKERAATPRPRPEPQATRPVHPAKDVPQGAIPEEITSDVSTVIDLPNLQLLPVIEDEISDGIPLPIELGKPKLVDEEAVTMPVPMPNAMFDLMHARTELALPIVDVQFIPDAVPVIPALVAQLAPQAIAEALTPLEQAVQDLISSLEDRDDDDDGEPVGTTPLLPEVKLLSVEHPDAPAPVAPVATEQELPEQPTNPSHVHLVIDDGAERVVVTVAVRGSEVNVALRGQDEATTAALARNAGSLEHAMRARGLDLASLMTSRDPDPQQRPAREQRERERSKATFSLEELA